MAIVKFKDTYDRDYLFDGTFFLNINASVDDIGEMVNPIDWIEACDNDEYDASYKEWVIERLNAEGVEYKSFVPHIDLVLNW